MQEFNPLVSIIINCYNGEKYLRETIDSVIAQTYTNWEIIFWDNQSTDDTANIVKGYNNGKIKYYYASNHTPLGEARNLALEAVSGECVCFLDADDLWKPAFLEKMVECMQNNSEVGLVYGDYCAFSDGTQRLTHHDVNPEGTVDTNTLLLKYDIGMSGALFKRSLLSEYNIRFNNNYNLIEDFDFFIRMSFVTTVYHVADVLILYRVHSQSLSRVYRNWSKEYKSFYDYLKEYMAQHSEVDLKDGTNYVYDMYSLHANFESIHNGDIKGYIASIMSMRTLIQKLKAIARPIKWKLFPSSAM
jgi:glycosyltransferase involved in cell wall biosynthesis